MALYLVNPAVEMSLELYISQQLEEAITIQYERIRDARVRDTFVKRLETRLERLLAESIDWDLKEPTEAQLKYAILVAKQTGIPLPSEARKFRFYTAMFLETYAVQAKESSSAAKRSIIGSVSEMVVAGKSESDATELDSTSAEGSLE